MLASSKYLFDPRNAELGTGPLTLMPRHCVGAGESENGDQARDCSKVDREYNIPLRIGLIFAVLGTSALGKHLSRNDMKPRNGGETKE